MSDIFIPNFNEIVIIKLNQMDKNEKFHSLGRIMRIQNNHLIVRLLLSHKECQIATSDIIDLPNSENQIIDIGNDLSDDVDMMELDTFSEDDKSVFNETDNEVDNPFKYTKYESWTESVIAWNDLKFVSLYQDSNELLHKYHHFLDLINEIESVQDNRRDEYLSYTMEFLKNSINFFDTLDGDAYEMEYSASSICKSLLSSIQNNQDSIKDIVLLLKQN